MDGFGRIHFVLLSGCMWVVVDNFQQSLWLAPRLQLLLFSPLLHPHHHHHYHHRDQQLHISSRPYTLSDDVLCYWMVEEEAEERESEKGTLNPLLRAEFKCHWILIYKYPPESFILFYGLFGLVAV